MSYKINEYPSKAYMKSQTGVPIIDVRTKEEWIETGILKGSRTLTFFDEMGQFDLDGFLSKLHSIIDNDKSKKFLLICRTGSRTGHISSYLFKLGYTVINLSGGIHYVKAEKSYDIIQYDGSSDIL